VVTNPHIKRVYNAYYHAFEVLRKHPPVTDLASNKEFCTLLRRLVDEHGETRRPGEGERREGELQPAASANVCAGAIQAAHVTLAISRYAFCAKGPLFVLPMVSAV
jgi:hypothetical protein